MQLRMTHRMAMFTQPDSRNLPAVLAAAIGLAVAAGFSAAPALAQNLPVTAGQKATATQVAQAGVPLSELAADAPDNYTVKSGDTLWAISGLFLKSPWRWPELWGMNMAEIRNPHRIYPGQQLFLEKKDGRATLRSRAGAGAGDAGIETVRVSPRVRSQSLADSVIPTLKSQYIEPFLSEPIVVDAAGLTAAPRIVATQEGRVMLSRGDRAYARGPSDKMIALGRGPQNDYRVFRNATPLKDPVSGEVLGYEAAVAMLDANRTVRYWGRIDDQFGVGYVRDVPQQNDLQTALDETKQAAPPSDELQQPAAGVVVVPVRAQMLRQLVDARCVMLGAKQQRTTVARVRELDRVIGDAG